MGLFDSFRDALRPDDASRDDAGAAEPKHLDRGAPPELVSDPTDLETPTGGKHARRD